MIKKIPKNKKIEIFLNGPDGNAFNLLGIAARLSRTLGLDKDKIHKEMTSGDYDHLLEVFDSYFGTFVTLYR